MRRFRWPLQRVLKVRAQRQQSLRWELLDLMQQITSARGEILEISAEVRSAMSAMSAASLADRMTQQEALARSVDWSERQIALLRGKIRELTTRRVAKAAELVKVRKTRETLERMREEARLEHNRSQLKAEQEEFDENFLMAFARKARPQSNNAMQES